MGTVQPNDRLQVDDSTVQKAVQGDGAALAQIYDTYTRDIYRYIFSKVGNSPDAEDLTAQTFMAVLESLPRYHHRGKFSAWIFQIARNKVMDHFRRSKHDSPGIPLELSYSDGSLDRVIQDEAYERLASVMEALTDEERELIRLRYVAQLSFVEIAELLGRKKDAVRKTLARLLERLSRQMEAQNAQ
jgi:RNA polymerase sigma-70 factor (ECF subfamily)